MPLGRIAIAIALAIAAITGAEVVNDPDNAARQGATGSLASWALAILMWALFAVAFAALARYDRRAP